MIAVGVDTHKHWHVVVALDGVGQLLGEMVVVATTVGYRELAVWLAGLGGEVVVGIEGAGSYGAGLCQHLQEVGIVVVEVERPRRRDRRAGKSDHLDALLAAKRVLARRWACFWSRIAHVWRSARGCLTSCRASTSQHRPRCANGSARATARGSPRALCGCATGQMRACRSRRRWPCYAIWPGARANSTPRLIAIGTRSPAWCASSTQRS
jgi:transposase